MKLFRKIARKVLQEVTMTTQVYRTLSMVCNVFSLFPTTSKDSIKFSQRECGYEIDEDELVRGLLVQLPGCLTDQSIPEVPPEEFEEVYGYFLS
jgi:hypothetical protein